MNLEKAGGGDAEKYAVTVFRVWIGPRQKKLRVIMNLCAVLLAERNFP